MEIELRRKPDGRWFYRIWEISEKEGRKSLMYDTSPYDWKSAIDAFLNCRAHCAINGYHIEG